MAYDPAHQATLLERAKAGDTSAYHELYFSIEKYAFRLAYRYKNRGVEIEDLVSEAQVLCLERLLGWEPEKGALTTYIDFQVGRRLDEKVRRLQKDVYVPHYADDIYRRNEVSIFSPEDGEGVIEIEARPETKPKKRAYCLADLEKSLRLYYRSQYDGKPDYFPAKPRWYFIKRYGLLGHEKRSVQEIAVEYKTTEEEVRQGIRLIAKKASRKKKCKICKIVFVAWKPIARYCSPRCSMQAVRNRRATPLPTLTCQYCGGSFVPSKYTRNKTPRPRNKSPKYCSRECWKKQKVRVRRERQSMVSLN